MKSKKNKNELTFSEHLHEFKQRILYTVVLFILIIILCYANCNTLMHFILKLGEDVGYKLVYIAPQEILVQQIRLAGVFSFLITLPVIVYNVSVFLAPVFTDSKKQLLKFALYCVSALIMFIVGCFFAYKLLLPFVFEFLQDVGESSGIQAQISTEKYLNLFICITLAIGVICEIPLLCILLTVIGILNANVLKKARPFVIAGSFIIGALITPPDVLSQIMVAVPMVVLYQISIWICTIIGKEKDHG